MLHRLILVHWDKAKAKAEAENIQAFEYKVDCDSFDGPPSLRGLRENPPAAVIIDLSRSPSMGRDCQKV